MAAIFIVLAIISFIFWAWWLGCILLATPFILYPEFRSAVLALLRLIGETIRFYWWRGIAKFGKGPFARKGSGIVPDAWMDKPVVRRPGTRVLVFNQEPEEEEAKE